MKFDVEIATQNITANYSNRLGQNSVNIKNASKTMNQESAFALHVLENEHFSVSFGNIRLLAYVHNEQKLDAYGSIIIHGEN